MTPFRMALDLDPTRGGRPANARIPLNDLRRQMLELGEEMAAAVEQVLASGRYVLGPNVTAFETEFADYCGSLNCISAANGTDALELALRTVGCGPGSEVVTVANAGMYASAAIVAIGARPVLADIERTTMTISPASLARCIRPATRAVIVTHLYGQLADMEGVLAVVRRDEIPVIEDCAQAHGARRNGKMAGTFGSIGCFSFYPTKNLGALGDGGALITADRRTAETLRSLRQYGWHRKYHAELAFGRNSRLDEVQAAVLRVKLPHLDNWNARRREIIGRYRQAGGDVLRIPEASGVDHSAHLCVVRSPRRAALREALARDGIASEIHYPVPDHHQEALREILPAGLSLPETEAAVAEILTIPCFPELTDQEVARVCDSLARFARRDRFA